jgi:hypothetical protein
MCRRRVGSGRRGDNRAWLQRSGGAARERQQSDVARALDGFAQPALVPRANAGHAPRQNLPTLLHELRQNVRALVVDEIHFLDAEFANFLLAEILALAARTSARTSGTTAAGSAFAPRSAMPAAGTTVSSMAAMYAFAPRCSTSSTAGRSTLFLFLCHTCLPFTCVSGLAGNKIIQFEKTLGHRV